MARATLAAMSRDTSAPDPTARTLDDVGKSIADMATAFGPLVAARKTLTDGGFSPEAADAIILTALQGATAQASTSSDEA